MKKLFAFLLTLVMVLSLAACGGNSGQDTSGSAPAQSDSGSSGGSDSAAPAAPTKLTLILRAGTYADVIKECLPAFEAENNVTCESLFIFLLINCGLPSSKYSVKALCAS